MKIKPRNVYKHLRLSYVVF